MLVNISYVYLSGTELRIVYDASSAPITDVSSISYVDNNNIFSDSLSPPQYAGPGGVTVDSAIYASVTPGTSLTFTTTFTDGTTQTSQTLPIFSSPQYRLLITEAIASRRVLKIFYDISSVSVNDVTGISYSDNLGNVNSPSAVYSGPGDYTTDTDIYATATPGSSLTVTVTLQSGTTLTATINITLIPLEPLVLTSATVDNNILKITFGPNSTPIADVSGMSYSDDTNNFSDSISPPQYAGPGATTEDSVIYQFAAPGSQLTVTLFLIDGTQSTQTIGITTAVQPPPTPVGISTTLVSAVRDYGQSVLVAVTDPIPNMQYQLRDTNSGYYTNTQSFDVSLPVGLNNIYISIFNQTSGNTLSGDVFVSDVSDISTNVVKLYNIAAPNITNVSSSGNLVSLSAYIQIGNYSLYSSQTISEITCYVMYESGGKILFYGSGTATPTATNSTTVSFTIDGGNRPGTLVSANGGFAVLRYKIDDGGTPVTLYGPVASVPTASSSGVICFLGNAPVLTPSGYRRIDSLREGDLVQTADRRSVTIQRAVHQRVAACAAVNPYVIERGQFGATRRFLISPEHRVAVAGRGMVEARHLGLQQEERTGTLDYYNLELPNWQKDNLVVAGVEVESLAPVRRIVVSHDAFRQMIARQYGATTPAIQAKILSLCKFLPGGRVEVPAMRR